MPQRSSSEHRKRIRSAQDHLLLLVENVKDYAIFMLDSGGHVMTWNRGAERLKGYRANEIIGQHFSIFYRPEEAEKPARELKGAIADGRFEDEGWRVRKDGSLFWANVVITAVYDETGRLHGFGKVTRDLTERRRSEEERIKLAEARAEIRLRDEFLSIASHELKTPLGALRLSLAGFELLMQRRPDDLAGMAQRLNLAITQVRRLDVLIERLLDVSRIAAGRLSLSFEEVDVAGLIRDVCQTFDDSARDAESELRFRDVGQESIVAFWDRVRIEQVLGNLIANSFKYAAGKAIDIDLMADAEAVTLSVADRGPGVEVADRERIFERFGTTMIAPHAVGLGLGLYIARQIVNAHGGTIHVDDGPEGGATFVVRLPLIAATPTGEIALGGEDGSRAADAR